MTSLLFWWLMLKPIHHDNALPGPVDPADMGCWKVGRSLVGSDMAVRGCQVFDLNDDQRMDFRDWQTYQNRWPNVPSS